MNYLGHTIVNGELKYASVSGVKLYDPRTKGGCPRRYHSRYVQGIREPDSDNVIEAKAAGIALDKEVKHYLRTGDKAISSLAIKGLHILETPGPDIGLDVPIHTTEYFVNGQPFAALPLLPNGDSQKYPQGTQVVIRSALTAAGIPFVGELDLVHRRGHYRDDEGEFHGDPPGTVEVGDIKFKTNANDRDGNSNFLMPSDLVRDIQMAGYGEWVSRVCPDATHVRLSLLYFPKKPAKVLPTKVTRLHVIDDCHRTWEYVEQLVRDMQQVARETDIEKVPGNTQSCDAYGGCPLRETCSAYKKTSLDGLWDKIAGDHLQEKNVGIIANNPGLMQQGAQPQQPTTQQQLAAEEQQMRAQVAQQQTQMPMNGTAAGADLQAVCYRLSQAGYGFPKLVGNAAQAYAAAAGQNVAPGFEFAGVMAPAGAARSLHTLPLSEVAHIYQLANEVAAELAKSMLSVQQQFVQAPSAPTAAFAPQGATTGAPISFLAPNAPPSMPQLAQAAPPPAYVLGSEPAATPPPKKKRGRPAADSGTAPENVAPPSSATQTATQAMPPTPAPPVTQVAPAAAPTFETAEAGGGLTGIAQAAPLDMQIYVNARCEGVTTKSLAGYVDYLNETIAKRYNVKQNGEPGPLDVRAAVDGSVLGYGGWKGVVRTIVTADPPPDGHYHFDTFMSELNEVVADALRSLADARGWHYVRGVRG